MAFPLTFPTQVPARIKLSARSVVAVVESQFSLAQTVQRHTGQAWAAEITWPTLARADAEEVISFLLELNGPEGTFLMGDPSGGTPRGSASSAPGIPLVAGVSQTGNSLVIDGLPAGADGYLLKGDYIQLGSGSTTRLYKNVSVVDTDSAGEATLTLWPRLRTSPANNDAVVVSSAKGIWRLGSVLTEWDIDEAVHYGISISAVEAV